MAPLFIYARTLVFFFSAFAAAQISNVTAPAPPGPYAPKLTIQELTDPTRFNNPFNKTGGPRKLMISRFDPIPKKKCPKICTAGYMPPATAAYYDVNASPDASLQLFEKVQMSGLCCCSGLPGFAELEAPMILFSPGFGTSRLVYSILAQYISSWGYTVITVDHTYDSNIIEFPDGTVIYGQFGNNYTLDDVASALAVRVVDMQFVGKKLSLPGAKVGLYGHSLGGATAATVMFQDKENKYIGGVNLDGSMFGGVADEGLGKGLKAFFLWNAQSHTDETDDTMPAWWNTTNKLNPRDPRWQLQLADSLHFTFSDLPLLADVSGARAAFPTYVEKQLGTIGGARSNQIILTYVKAVFDLSLKHRPQLLLKQKTSPYPEVTIIEQAGY